MKKFLLILVAVFVCGVTSAKGKFSTAGFYEIADVNRAVYSMNPSWLLHVGVLSDKAAEVDFDDSKWNAVNLPNGIEILPKEASGGKNYRGEVWYRKHFEIGENLANQRVTIYFEAIMGKSKIYVNGKLLKEHFGGFTPIVIDVTDHLRYGSDNLIAVCADNSDDPIYPPGKPQTTLDFCYFGGIYRDCFMVTTSKEVYITDPNEVDKVAGGGVVVAFENVSDNQADVIVKTDFVGKAKVEYTLKDATGNVIYKGTKGKFSVKNPKLWSPESPNLYNLEIRLVGSKNRCLDGYMKRIGIRSLDYDFHKGLILNGKQYPRKIIGANRHQDFAVVGNALSNSLHYRDAKKLKESGMEIIRNAHYPQDPAFMDACDELGLFMIVNTPGWQFWNEAPIFEQRVYDDVRNIARRDRNNPCVIMWEPILNETWYPESFAKNVHDIIKQEVPFKGCNYTAADQTARGAQYFDIIFKHPDGGLKLGHEPKVPTDTTKVYFTREWGDNVDDWNSHNSTSRVDRVWGEKPQLIQATHYAKAPYSGTDYDVIQITPTHHMGGTLWHSFDHQRGYHPDPFYGGIMDAFRRPKTSYYMFQAQTNLIAPMVHIAHEMTPFSDKDVVVFSNAEAVRLKTFYGDSVRLKKRDGRWFTFENAWDFMADKKLSRGQKQEQAYFLAEALDADGNVVATQKKSMSRRPSALVLEIDTMNVDMVANGGDLVVVTAKMVDKFGQIKRLNQESVRFAIQGEGRLVGSPETFTNPVKVEWGEAPILVQSTTTPGKITIKAEVVFAGENLPTSAQIEFNTVKSNDKLIYDQTLQKKVISNLSLHKKVDSDAKATQQMLQEVEKQQTQFGE